MSSDLYAVYVRCRTTGLVKRLKCREPGSQADMERIATWHRQAEAVSNTADNSEVVALPFKADDDGTAGPCVDKADLFLHERTT